MELNLDMLREKVEASPHQVHSVDAVGVTQATSGFKSTNKDQKFGQLALLALMLRHMDRKAELTFSHLIPISQDWPADLISTANKK